MTTAHQNTESQLQALLKEASQKVEVGAYYAHYRNLKEPYKVLGLCLLEGTEEVAVLYQKEGKDALPWVRALSSWQESVLVEGKAVPRFQKVSIEAF